MGLFDAEVSRLARRRHSVLTTADLVRIGRTPEQVRRAAQRGELETMHPGIHRVAAAPVTWEQRLLLAVLAGGAGTLASHRSAAALWGLDGSTKGRPEIVTPRHLRSWAPHLGKVHESTDLHLAEPTERLTIPCTGLVRTLVDLGAVVPVERVQQTIDDAIRRSLCTWDDLAHALVRHSRRGRRGVGPLRAILDECYGTTVPDSNFNRLVARLLTDSGLPAPELEHRVLSPAGEELGRVDLAYVEQLVGIELDSRKHHLTAAAFEADRVRQNRLELHGWIILRYTWLHYTKTPNRIVTDVVDALRVR